VTVFFVLSVIVFCVFFLNYKDDQPDNFPVSSSPAVAAIAEPNRNSDNNSGNRCFEAFQLRMSHKKVYRQV